MDATTNQITLTLSMPIRHPDGSLAGVAAIDTQIRHILLERETAARWSRSMSTFWSERKWPRFEDQVLGHVVAGSQVFARAANAQSNPGI